MDKIRLGIIFGGKTPEHEVSLQSAKNIVEALDRDKYDVFLLGVDKTGKWQINNQASYLLNEQDPKIISLNQENSEIALGFGKKQMVEMHGGREIPDIDVAFPIIHGVNGEDGTIQGLLKLAGIPFVGAGVLGSAVGMDKDIAKKLLRDAGLPQGQFYTLRKHLKDCIDYDDIESQIGKYPMFVKPANMGSSIGVNKAKNRQELQKFIQESFVYDTKVIVEEFIDGRELECAVLGNENPQASVVGEVISHHDFYSYDAKYIDENGAGLEIPAHIPPEIQKRVQELSIQVFQTLECEGLARVDFFLTADEKLYVNEINTLPGFTKISMYPKLWEASGVSYTELIDRLISLAIERGELLK